jgi:hypothetical protein
VRVGRQPDSIGTGGQEPGGDPQGSGQRARAGVSDDDAEALKKAFNVKTVGDLGKNKFFKAAQALTLLGEAG